MLNIGEFDTGTLFVILFITSVVLAFTFRKVNDYRARWLIIACISSVFLYSGVGISYTSVDNKYVYSYGLFVLCFCLPFCFYKNIVKNNDMSQVDIFLFNHYSSLKKIALFYLFLKLIPCIYPEFRLFQPFTVRDSYWDMKAVLGSDPINIAASTLSLIIKPFFFAYIVCYAMKNPNGKKHIALFCIEILLDFLKLHYIARNTIATYLIELLILIFCLKGNQVIIKRKHIMTVSAIVVMLIPFFYAYKFAVTGNDFDSAGLSFVDMAELLMEQELTYPQFYDEILSSSQYNNLSIGLFLAYIICLPIPSFIWPGKPSINFADLFTYGTLGLKRGDTGFYILLPSALGESFMVGGYWFSWLFALLSGLAIVVITRYISKHTTLIYYFFYLVIQSATYGRGGTAGLLPTFITGMLGVFILDIFLSKTKR